MTDKLCCIILDALGPYSIRQLDMEYIQSLYHSSDTSSGLMGTSGLAHTPISNALMWGDYHNEDQIWVEFDDRKWTSGVGGFDPIVKDKEDEARLYSRSDFDTSFVWDVLDHHGYNATALGIPICLPPYSFNELDSLDEAWFPHTEEHLATHIREKPSFVQQHIERGDEFICTSIKAPDQWLHGLGSEHVTREFIEDEVPVLEDELETTIEQLESAGYEWLVFGDHGAPIGGRTTNYTSRKMLARHRKEALIIGSGDDVPSYTGEMYDFILDYFSVEDADVRPGTEHENSTAEEVTERLEAMGYL